MDSFTLAVVAGMVAMLGALVFMIVIGKEAPPPDATEKKPRARKP